MKRLNWLDNTGALIAFAGIAFLLYWHVLPCAEFPWDDAAYRSAAREVLVSVSSAFHQVQGNYHPLTMLSLAVDEHFGSGEAQLHHVTNVALHGINAFLLFLLLRSLFTNASAWLLVAGAVLFLVHPAQVESVAWISERKNLLFAGFILLACWAYVNHLRSAGWTHYPLVLLASLAAMLSKVQAVSLPVVLFGLLVVQSGWPVQRKRWLELLPVFLFAVAAAWFGLQGQVEGSYVHAQRDGAVLARFVVVAQAALMPYYTALWPWSVSIVKPLPRMDDPVVWAWVAAFIACMLLWSFALWQRRWKAVGMGLVLAALVLPVAQLVPFGSMVSADRYAYLPIAALVVITVGVAQRYRYAPWPLFAISVPLVILTVQRVQDWCEPQQLFAHALERYPNSEMAHMNMAAQLVANGDPEQAAVHLSAALALDPGLLEARQLQADLLNKSGRSEEAFLAYSQVISRGKDWRGVWRARMARAKLNIARGNANGALEDLRVAEVPMEKRGERDHLLGLCFAMLNDHASAVQYFERSLKQGETAAQVKLNLAISHGWLANFDLSLNYARAVMQQEPDNAEAWFILGLSEERTGADGCASLARAAGLGHPRAAEAVASYCR
ncbi:MAG: hypothetical protein KF905_02505 [Flavobacteriales bacterium]|nr:hypothetical protein [Flavobacteriales bacterium]